MRFDNRSPHRRTTSLLGAISAIGIALAVSGCASAPPGPERDTRSVARDLGFPGCNVSVPLSQAEVIENARRIGNPYAQSFSTWKDLVAKIQPGDQLRLVDCRRESRHRDVGDPYYYALFRAGKVVAEFHFILLD